MADVVSVYRLTMDIKKPTTHIVTPVIVQYDNVRLEVTVLDDGKPFDLTNVSNVEFTHKRPDLEVIVEPGEVEDGKIVYRYAGNEMDIPGNIKASFSMINGDEKVSVRDFYVVVQKSLKESQYMPGAPKVDRLQQLIVEVETLSAAVQPLIEEATTQSAYAKEQGDLAKEQADYIREQVPKLENLEVQYAPRLNEVEEGLKRIEILVPEVSGDSRQTIQDAIDGAPYGSVVKLSNGYTYTLNSLTDTTAKHVLVMKDGVSLSGNAIIKIGDGLGDYEQLFNFSDKSDINFSDLTIDENTINNPKTNNTGTNGARRSTFFAYGSNRSKNITFKDLTINDCIGVWQLSVYGENVVVDNLSINYNQTETSMNYDRTSLYAAFTGVVKNCKFNGSLLANTGMEMHNTELTFENNVINNYNLGVIITNDYAQNSKVEKLVLAKNKIKARHRAAMVWFESSRNVGDVDVFENILEVTGSTNANPDFGFGLYESVGSGIAIDSVKFENNKIYSNNTRGTRAFSFVSSTSNADAVINKLTLKNNELYGNFTNINRLETQPLINSRGFKINHFTSSYNDVYGQVTGSVISVTDQQGSFKDIRVEQNNLYIDALPTRIVSREGTFVLEPYDEMKFLNNKFYKAKPTILSFNNNYSNCYIVQELDSLQLPDRMNADQLKIGSKFISNKGFIKKFANDNWVLEMGDIDIPTRNFYYKNSTIKNLGESLYDSRVCIKRGYVADKLITAGNHTVGEYTGYGLYVYRCIQDNNDTLNTDNTANFVYLGERANFGYKFLDLLGTTANRPTTGLLQGVKYFDTTLNKQITWNGSNWVDSNGLMV